MKLRSQCVLFMLCKVLNDLPSLKWLNQLFFAGYFSLAGSVCYLSHACLSVHVWKPRFPIPANICIPPNILGQWLLQLALVTVDRWHVTCDPWHVTCWALISWASLSVRVTFMLSSWSVSLAACNSCLSNSNCLAVSCLLTLRPSVFAFAASHLASSASASAWTVPA